MPMLPDPLNETPSAAKARMRAEALSRRDALDLSHRIAASYSIAERAMADWPDGSFGVVGGYLPIRSEVDPRPLMALAADRGLRLAVPAIVGSDLEFRALERGAALEPQGHGTHAPGNGAQRLRPDILLVPLAAFDRRLHRIGYGGGFYDRAIERMQADGRPLLTIGLAFSAQEVDLIPEEPFDIALDRVVTERGTVRRSAAARPPS